MNLKFIKILGLYQLIAGALGILTYLFFFHTIDLLNVTLNGLSVYSGYLLLKKDFKKGPNLSIINQFLQIIGVSLLGFTFKFVAGICLGFYIDLTSDTIIGASVNLNIWQMSFSSNTEQIRISLNFIPVILINYIFREKAKLN